MLWHRWRLWTRYRYQASGMADPLFFRYAESKRPQPSVVGQQPKEAKDLVNWRIRPGRGGLMFACTGIAIILLWRHWVWTEQLLTSCWFIPKVLCTTGQHVKCPVRRKIEWRQAWTIAEEKLPTCMKQQSYCHRIWCHSWCRASNTSRSRSLARANIIEATWEWAAGRVTSWLRREQYLHVVLSHIRERSTC